MNIQHLKTNFVRVWNYGNYSSSNYGSHTQAFTDSTGNNYYFSYKTLIAFNGLNTGLVIMKNYWSTTTGKHLNWIDPDHSVRVDEETFNIKLKQLQNNKVKK